jgi:glycosyltransferase involved in cell wall biosynthesis
MNKPKISVLITVYNGEKFLEETIKSILNQTFKDFELIIVDDGSIDNTKKVIQKFKDKRIKYYYYGKNKGYQNLHNVINFGLEKCRGKYLARTDSDDISYPNRLKIQYQYLEKHPKIFMIGSSADVIDKNGKIIGKMIKKPWPSIILKFTIGFNNPFTHSSIMFRNEGLKYPSYAEHYFFVQSVLLGKRLKNLREKLIAYRINPRGLVANSGTLEGNKYKDFYQK